MTVFQCVGCIDILEPCPYQQSSTLPVLPIHLDRPALTCTSLVSCSAPTLVKTRQSFPNCAASTTHAVRSTAHQQCKAVSCKYAPLMSQWPRQLSSLPGWTCIWQTSLYRDTRDLFIIDACRGMQTAGADECIEQRGHMGQDYTCCNALKSTHVLLPLLYNSVYKKERILALLLEYSTRDLQTSHKQLDADRNQYNQRYLTW